MLLDKTQDSQPSEAPLLDTPAVVHPPAILPPGNPADRVTELTFAEKYLQENPEFNEQLEAITKIEQMQARGHMPLYYELYAKEVEDKTASIIETASKMYTEGYQELAKTLTADAIEKREIAKVGAGSDSEVYETVAEMTLTQAFMEAKEEDEFLESDVFSPELIARAAKDRRDTNILEDAFQEIMIKMQEEYGDRWFGGKAVDTLGNVFDPTDAFAVNQLIDDYIDDPEIKAQWLERWTGWNSYEQIAAFGLFLRQLDAPQQLRVMEDVSKRAFGFLGMSHNPKSTIEFITKLQDYSVGDAALANIMTVLDYSIVADLALLVKPAFMLGKAATLHAKIAGAKAAGRELAKDIAANGVKASNADALNKLAIPGMDPVFRQKGVAEGTRQALNEEASQFLDDYKQMLLSQGVPEPTVAQMIINLAESTMSPETMRSLRSIVLDPSEKSLASDGDILWQAPDGRAFPTRKAAEEWAVAHGFKDFEVLEPRMVDGDVPITQGLLESALKEADTNAQKLVIIDHINKLDQMIKSGAPKAEISEMAEMTASEVLEEIKYLDGKVQKTAKNIESYLGIQAADELVELNDFIQGVYKRILQAAAQGDDTIVDQLTELWALAHKQLTDKLISYEVRMSEALEKTARHFGGWEKGSGLKVSSGIASDSRLAGALKSLHAKYGLGDLIVYTRQEADDLGLVLQSVRHKNPLGTALNDVADGRGQLNMVVLDTSRTAAKRGPTQQVRTLAHELGHVFDYQFLQKNPILYSKILGEFNKWFEGASKATGSSFRARMASRQGPVPQKGIVARAKESNNLDEYANKFKGYERNLEWQLTFREWWADQFAKHAFTNPTVSGEVAKFFQAAVRRFGDIYKTLAKHLGLGNTDVFKNPVKAVRDILDEHIEMVRVGTVRPGILDDLDFRRGLVELNDSAEDLIPKRSPKEVDRLIQQVKEAAHYQAVDDSRDAQGFIVRTPAHTTAPRYDEASFEGLDYAPATQHLSDPRSSVVPELFKAGVIKEYGEERLLELFRNYQKRILPSNQKELAAIERHLARGDAYSNPRTGKGRIFTVDELYSSGDLVNDSVIKGYYGMVQLRKLMHTIHNKTIVDELTARGFREFKVKKPVRSPDLEMETDLVFHAAPVKAVDSLIGTRAYDAASSAAVEISQELIERLQREGGHVLRLRRPQYLSRDPVLDEYVVVMNSDLGSRVKMTRIQQALGYRPGEIARYYTDSFFIDMSVANRTTKDADPHKMTIRTAPDVVSAKKYVDTMNQALRLLREWKAGRWTGNAARAVNDIIGTHSDAKGFFRAFREGDFDDVREFSYRYDRQSKDDLLSVIDLTTPGGVLRSKRKGKLEPFDFQVNPGRDNVAKPLQSLLQEARTVTRYATTHDLRTTQIEKFINTFGDLFKSEIVPGDPWLTWQRIQDTDLGQKGTRKALIAENARRYLREHLGVLDKEELKFVNSTVDRMTRWQLNYAEKNGSRLKAVIADQVLGYLDKGITPINWLRGLNFNFMLGMWNPAQTFVQAQGGVTALAISPVNGFKAWNRAIAYRMAATALENDGVLAKIGEALGKAGGVTTGVSPQELREIITLMKDSGILSNMAMSAFHNTDTIGKLRAKPGDGSFYHRFFYNRGEEFTRITAWETARLDWIAKNPTVNWKSKAAQREILEMADNYMLNMNKANRASWQKGIFSIPLQFLQWNIKFHNQLVRGIAGGRSNFTRPQALRLLAAHYLAYGTRGNAFGNFMEAIAPDEWFQQEDGWDDERRIAVTQGAFALALKQMVEVFSGDDTFNVALGTRLGTTRWLQDIVESFTEGGSPFIEAALGPSGNVLKNAAGLAGSGAEAALHTVAGVDDRLSDIISFFYPGNDTPSWKTAITQEDINMSQWVDVIEDLAAITSGLNNMSKAYMWHQMEGYALNKQGKKVAGVTPQEIWGKAIFGADPASVDDTWKLYKAEKDHRAVMKDYAKRISELQDNEIRARMAGQTKLGDQYSRRWRMLYSSLEVDEQWEIRHHLINVYGPANTLRGKLLLDYFFRPNKYEVGIQSGNQE